MIYIISHISVLCILRERRKRKLKDVKQKQIQPDEMAVVTMDLKRSQFLVKNFTSEQIEVYLGDNDNFSIIGPGSWERVFNNIDDKKGNSAEATNKISILGKAAGVVEVASIDF